MKLPFVGPSYTLDARQASAQRSVNLYLVGMETPSKAGVIMRAAPGLVIFSALEGGAVGAPVPSPAPPDLEMDWEVMGVFGEYDYGDAAIVQPYSAQGVTFSTPTELYVYTWDTWLVDLNIDEPPIAPNFGGGPEWTLTFTTPTFNFFVMNILHGNGSVTVYTEASEVIAAAAYPLSGSGGSYAEWHSITCTVPFDDLITRVVFQRSDGTAVFTDDMVFSYVAPTP